MRRRIAPLALAAVLCATLSGCGGDHSYVRFSSGGMPPAGVATSGSTVYVNSSGSASALGTFFAALILASHSYLSDLEVRGAGMTAWPGSYPVSGWGVPPLDPARRVVEHDCSKPIEDWSANLQCR
jgi:hypothetical protein